MRQHLTCAFLKYQELGRYLSWLEEGLDKSCCLVNLFAGKRIPDLTPLSIPEPYRSLLLSTLELQAVGSSVLTRGCHNLLDLARRIHSGALINPKAYQQVCDIKGPRTPQEELISLLQEFAYRLDRVLYQNRPVVLRGTIGRSIAQRTKEQSFQSFVLQQTLPPASITRASQMQPWYKATQLSNIPLLS